MSFWVNQNSQNGLKSKQFTLPIITAQSDYNQINKLTDFGPTYFPISERDLKRGMRLLRLDVGVRSILASWDSNQNVTCNKERDSITDVWPLRVFKSSNFPLFFAPHLCNLKENPFFSLPLAFLEISNHMRPRLQEVTPNHALPLNTIKNAKPLASLWLYHPAHSALLILFHSWLNLSPSPWGILLLFTMRAIALFYIS